MKFYVVLIFLHASYFWDLEDLEAIAKARDTSVLFFFYQFCLAPRSSKFCKLDFSRASSQLIEPT